MNSVLKFLNYSLGLYWAVWYFRTMSDKYFAQRPNLIFKYIILFNIQYKKCFRWELYISEWGKHIVIQTVLQYNELYFQPLKIMSTHNGNAVLYLSVMLCLFKKCVYVVFHPQNAHKTTNVCCIDNALYRFCIMELFKHKRKTNFIQNISTWSCRYSVKF
jgi:hypothetical protein